MKEARNMVARRGGKRVGYKRVSTIDQNTERQLQGVDVDKVFEDKASGKDTNRPALQSALEYLRDGDVLVVHSMDRLARNLGDLLKLIEGLNGRGVAVEFVKESVAFTGEDSPMAKLQLHIMGAVAEFERSMIRARQAEGIAAAKARGEYAGRGGRPSKFDPETAATIRQRVDAGESVSALAREFNTTRQTIYSAIGA
jgi:DNA invertase Pin-like site-specific DNA recombinase